MWKMSDWDHVYGRLQNSIINYHHRQFIGSNDTTEYKKYLTSYYYLITIDTSRRFVVWKTSTRQVVSCRVAVMEFDLNVARGASRDVHRDE